MQAKSKKHSIDSLFTFLLLLIFCVFTLMLSGTGSTIYRNGAAYLDENYTSRTAIAYVSEKIRQHDEAGAVFTTSLRKNQTDKDAEEIPALGFLDKFDGKPFVTYVYFFDDALCELTIQKDKAPEAEMGSRIVELSSLSIEAVSDTNMLSVAAASKRGNKLSLLIHLSSSLGNS